MRILKLMLLALIALTGSAYAQNVGIKSAQVSRSGNNIEVTIDFTTENIATQGWSSVTYKPVLSDGVHICGLKYVNYRRGEQPKTKYTALAKYQDWMDGAKLRVTRELINSQSKKLATDEQVIRYFLSDQKSVLSASAAKGKSTASTSPAKTPATTYAAVVDAPTKKTAKSAEATAQTKRNGKATMGSAGTATATATAPATVSSTTATVNGMLDGESQQSRSEKIASLSKAISALETMAATSTGSVTGFIGSYAVPSEDISDEQSSKDLYLSLDEMRICENISPELLTQRQLYEVAQSYREENADKYYEVMMKTVKIYSTSPSANLNAASICLERNDVNDAAGYLKNARMGTPEYKNVCGIYDILTGNYVEGIKKLKAAKAAGCIEAGLNLDYFFTNYKSFVNAGETTTTEEE